MYDATRYAVTEDGVHLAYQVTGEGPVDLVMVPGFISHVEHRWREPALARFLRSLGTFSKVIGFDKRGMGLSDRDPVDATPSLSQRVADIGTVMDAAGSRRAVLFAWSEGGATAIRFAITQAERTAGLILVGTTPRFSAAPDFPAGIPRELLELAVEVWQEEWGKGVSLPLYAPSAVDDARFAAWWAAYQRHSASPGAVANSLMMHFDVDVRPDLPNLRVPTLIVHQINDMVIPVTCARYAAAHIPSSTYCELPGSDHMYWLGDQRDTIDSIRRFLVDSVAGEAVKRRPRRPAFGWDSLTPTELEVAWAVGEGLTTRQIGERLFVSPRTVQSHITSILRKMGANKRSAIAAEAARRYPQP